MKASTKRILFVVVAMAFLLGAVFVYSSMIRGAYDSVQLLRGEVASKQEDFIRYQSTVQRVEQLLGQFQNAEEVQRQVSLIFPDGPEVGYATNQIVELARINGLALSGLSTSLNATRPSSLSVVRNIGSITAEVQLTGSYAGFKAFLRQLENNILLTDVGIMRVEQIPGSLGGGLQYTLSITSYYQSR